MPANRLSSFLRLVEAFDRDEIETGVDLLIAALDACDDDPDLEPNGDEADASIPEGWDLRSIISLGRLDLEDHEDDDEDRCLADDDHGTEPTGRTDTAAAWPGDPDDAEDDDDDRCLAADDGCAAIVDARGAVAWGSREYSA